MLGLRIPCEYRITNTSLSDRLESRYNIANLSLIESFTRCVFWPKTPYLEYLYLGSSIDEFEFVSFFYLTAE